MKDHFSRTVQLALLIGVAQTMLGHAQTLSGDALVKALKSGGYVIVMRHASSPRELPDQNVANADNKSRERQLDETGRATAKAMGEALRQLQIPIGEIYTSPTYRALETIRLLGLASPKTVPELGDGGQSMQGVTNEQSAWLLKRANQFSKGTNILIVTHFPNMTKAFPQWTSGLADGEAIILGSDGKGSSALIARVKIEQWPQLRNHH